MKPTVPATTAAPLRMVSVPLPSLPMSSELLLVQLEPAPSTITVPIEPPFSPMMPAVLLTVPPAWMVNVPVAEAPTLRLTACAPAVPTTVALGVMVSIVALVPLVGTPPDQLPALNQLFEVVPVQSTAREGVVVAATSPSATTDVALRRKRQAV